MIKNNKIYNNCIVVTHASDINGPPHALSTYLKDKTNYLIVIEFPLALKDQLKPRYKVFKEGILIEEKESKLIINPFILNYIKDLILTFIWSQKLIKKYKIHLPSIFCCNNFLVLSGMALRFFKKINYLIFYSVDYSDKRFNNNNLNKIYLKIDKIAALKADFVWSNTDRTRFIRREQGTKEKANLYVPNGVFFENIKYYDKQIDIKQIRIEYHGYIAESKGVQNIIYALEKTKLNNFIFDITGYGPYENELKSIANNSTIKDKITFKGKVPIEQILNDLGSYDLSVALINPKEDYIRYCDPMKVKEALACQLPVLISNVPEVALMIKDKKLGIVVENSEDIEEVTQALKKILENPFEIRSFKKNILSIKDSLDWNYIYKNALSYVK